MSLTSRKARPLTRENSHFRDDRLFLVACDDTYAPEQYFGFFDLRRVKIFVLSSTDNNSHAKHALDRLLAYIKDIEEDDELWMLLDVDHCLTGTHQHPFVLQLQEAHQRGIRIALSNPCFELWLLLHYVDESKVKNLTTAGETIQMLREYLPDYSKKSLVRHHYPFSLVAEACRRAARLNDGSQGFVLKSCATDVHQLWLSIIGKALPSQLPEELMPIYRELKSGSLAPISG